jgi:hypothetical protein
LNDIVRVDRGRRRRRRCDFRECPTPLSSKAPEPNEVFDQAKKEHQTEECQKMRKGGR